MCYDLLYTVTLRAASADIRTPDLSESICVRSSVIKLQRACLQRWLHNMTGIVKHGTASRFRILTGLSRTFTGCGWQTLAPAVFHLVTGGDDHILSMQSCVRSPRKTWHAQLLRTSSSLAQLCAFLPFMPYRNAAAAAAKALRFQAVGEASPRLSLATEAMMS